MKLRLIKINQRDWSRMVSDRRICPHELRSMLKAMVTQLRIKELEWSYPWKCIDDT